MKKYKITHLISAEFVAHAIVTEDQINTKTNDLKEYNKPDSKFNFTMLKGSENIIRTTYEEYDEKLNISTKDGTSNK
tara:strand:- start:21 stop:251 length:231 start_codon:yes stop_codon:yes gene_type:complete